MNAGTVAKTIMSQLYTMDKNLMWALGATKFTTDSSASMPGLTFRVNGVKHKGYVRITLDEGADLYNVRIFTRRKVLNQAAMKEVVKFEIEEVFFDDLPSILENHCY
jgi:hypothetical protein